MLAAPALAEESPFLAMLASPFKGTDEAGEKMCGNAGYKKPEKAEAHKYCLTCQETLKKWKKKAGEVAKKAGAADSLFSLAGITGTTAGVNQTTNNNTAQVGAGTNTTAGMKAQKDRANNATAAKAEFEKCKAEIDEQCGGKPGLFDEDKPAVASVKSACEKAGGAADKFAKQKSQDAMDLNKLAQMAGLASAAMGMIPKPQPGSDSDLSTSPTPASLKEAAEIGVSKIGGASGTPSVNIGTGKGQEVAVASAGAPGSGLSGASFTSDDFSAGGSSSSPLGEGVAGNGSGASGGSSGGGGGGGSDSSSGSSRAAEVAAILDASGYEVNGGGSRPMGLRAGKSDSDAGGEAPSLEPSAPFEELQAREPASEELAEEEDVMSGTDSIFARVRSKYSLLKGAGRI